MCGFCAVWCVGTLKIFKELLSGGTLKIFKVPLCVGSVLWCVETLKICKELLCVDSLLWCVGTLKNFPKIKKSMCWDFFPVLERLIIFKKIPVLGIFPCAGEIGFFRVKIPVLETFFAPCSKKKNVE